MENLTLLPFGNVTVVCIALVLIVLAIALVLELGIWVVRLLIAADDPHAPVIVIKNFVKDVIVKVWGLLVVETTYEEARGLDHLVVEIEGKWYVIDESKDTFPSASYLDVESISELGTWSWKDDSQFFRCCKHSNKNLALLTAQKFYNKKVLITKEGSKENLYKLLASILVVDVTLLLLKVNFTLTVVALGIFATGFSTRFIAKKLYKTMSRTTKNEVDIKDLQETVKVKGI